MRYQEPLIICCILYITSRQMWMHYLNVKSFFIPENDEHQLEQKLEAFFTSQEQWMVDEIAKYGTTVPLWRHVSYIKAHLDGLYEGYKGRAQESWVSAPLQLA